MPDRQLSPDEGHAAIQVPLWAAIDDLTEQIERVDDAYLLLLSTTDFAQGTLNTVLAGQAAIGKLQAAATDLAAQLAGTAGALVARLDNLAARVAALEAAAAHPCTPTEEIPDEPSVPTGSC